jgi:hypothetical protein
MKHLLPIAMTLLPFLAMAQDKEPFNLSWRYTPVKTGDTAHHIQDVDVSLAVPIRHNEKSTLDGVIAYRQITLGNFGERYPGTVYGTSASLNYLTRFNGDHQLRLFGRAGFDGDFKDGLSNDFRWTAGFEYFSSYGQNGKLGLGLAYSRQFFGNELIPLLEINKQLTERLRLYGVFPTKPRLEYTLDSRSKAGVGLNLEVSSYRLSGDNSADYLKTTLWNGLLYYQYSIYKHWSINVSGGYYVSQKYEIFNQANTSSWTLLYLPIGKQLNPVYSVNKSAVNFQIGIVYSIH